MDSIFFLALFTLLLWLVAAIEVLRGNRSVIPLRAVAPVLADAPKVSIVVAARNEEEKIEEALASLLALDYPDLELVVVDDRSEDSTGAILDEKAAGNERLHVVHVEELPSGWLGKNHALWIGSRRATGELILFTDADIVMEKTLIKRAAALLQRRRLDHLVVSPRMTMPGTLLPMFGLTFMLIFGLFTRPWKAKDPKSRCHIGIGAFNLVRASAYRACGGHEAIRMRPDDDLKLGKLIKKNGLRQDIAYGPEFMTVEWYSSLKELIIGLEKNAFAGCDYRLWMALGGVALQLLLGVFPYLALLITSGPTRWLYLGSVLLITVILVDCAAFNRARRWHAIGYPVTATLFVWIVLRTTTLNLVQGGISWRGTFYSLKELRRNRV